MRAFFTFEPLEARRMFAASSPPASLEGLMIDLYATTANPPFAVGDHEHVEVDGGGKFRDIDTEDGSVLPGTYTYYLSQNWDADFDLTATQDGKTATLPFRLTFASAYGGKWYLRVARDEYNLGGDFAVNPQPGVGTIRGVVFNDLDGNGRWAETEPPMVGAQVFIDKNGNGVWDPGIERARATDQYGRYAFKNINTGYHAVRTTMPAGFVATRPAANRYAVTLTPNTLVNDRNFARTNNGRIYGRALMDVMTNGTEYGTSIPGYAYLDINHNGVRDSLDIVTAIASDGKFSLAAQPGNYVLRIDPRTSFALRFTRPSSVYYRVSLTGTEAVGEYLFLAKGPGAV